LENFFYFPQFLIEKEGRGFFFQQFTENNHKIGRSELAAASGANVPYLGMFLTDLTLIDEALPAYTPHKLINFTKHRKVAKIMQLILRSQRLAYPLMIQSFHFK